MEDASQLRLGVFLGLFVLLAICELIVPRRPLRASKTRRWFSNIGLTTVNSVVISLIPSLMAVEMAYRATEHGWGLLNYITLPPVLAIVLTVVVFDCLIYWQHVFSHTVPMFWRFHRVHHSDVDLDVTSGARFHTIEILISMLIKLAAICIIGPPAWGILLFEIILNGTAMFNHSNIRLPLGLDRIVRTVLVTPDMHRVHHSVHRDETDSNYGFNLPWWDYIFGTYTAQPRDGHDEMTIGLHAFRASRDQDLDRLLVQPFRTESEDDSAGETRSAEVE